MGAWYEVTFDNPTVVDEEVRILVEPTAGITNNFIGVRVQTSDVKASENASTINGGSWAEDATYDTAYIYTYVPPVPIGLTLRNRSLEMTLPVRNLNLSLKSRSLEALIVSEQLRMKAYQPLRVE